MKTILPLFILLFLPTILLSQPGVPRDVEIILSRIEQAFDASDPDAIGDLFPVSIKIRLEDSLYMNVSRIRASELLNAYFADKESVRFRFNTPGHGTLAYTENGIKKEVSVDVWLVRYQGEVGVYALNISNYPSATVFMPPLRAKQ